jgi:N-acetylglucosamine kinase-like BadF-type ATPase
MTYLIADSGATKTDWLYVDGADTIHIKTQGLHPSNIEQLSDSMEIQTQIGHLEPSKIYFFGAGCGNPVSNEIVRRFLQPIFPGADVRIKSDLEGSGKAFFGEGNGVVAVLGTGSICAKIEGGKVVKKSAALGFAIGDEGSAADLGRRILRMYYRKTGDPESILFIDEKLNGADYATMMNKIYRAGKPNRALAAVAGEVLQYPLPPGLTDLIAEGFKDFVSLQLSMLNLTGGEQIVFTGKVAHIHNDLLFQVLKSAGFEHTEVRYPVVASFRNRIKQNENIFLE